VIDERQVARALASRISCKVARAAAEAVAASGSRLRMKLGDAGVRETLARRADTDDRCDRLSSPHLSLVRISASILHANL
jgi:hypothetical protein